MRARSAFITEIQRLLNGENADPRPAQAVFLLPVFVDLGLRLVSSATTLDRYFAIGSAVALVPTLGALAIGTGRMSPRWTIWLPVLDIVALSIYRLNPDTAIGVAVAFPAIWLGLQFGRRGVVITGLVMALTFALPTLVVLGPTLATFSRILQVLLMAVIASAVCAASAEMWRRKSAEATAHAERFERAMQDLVAQRRFSQSIFDSVDVGLIALDADGTYVSMNPKHHEFMQLAYPDGHGGVAGQTGFVYCADGVTLLDRPEDMPTIRALQGEALRDYTIWVGRDPSVRRALAVSSTPRVDESGRLEGVVLAYHDITELVMASRIKEEFVASVSHELRTPLTSIIGYVDVLLDDVDDLPEDVRHYLSTVQRNARRLHRLVDDLLASALESVATVLEVRPVSVGDLVRLCALEAAKSAPEAGLTFELEDPPGGADLWIAGDAERLSQVFDNLLSNAVKYTPAEGRVHVVVRHEGGDAVVEVHDTGRGISPEELPSVFSKFFRSSSVQRDAIPGVGLGLAITRTIVESHGGSVEARSTLGVGSVFQVRLPLSAALGPSVAPVASAVS